MAQSVAAENVAVIDSTLAYGQRMSATEGKLTVSTSQT